MKKSRAVFLAVSGLCLVLLAASWTCSRGPASSGSASRQSAVTYTCPMHPDYRSDRPGDCPMCGMRLVPATARDDGGVSSVPGAVRINADRQQIIGVRTGAVDPAAASHLTVRVPGRVAVDDQRVYRITAAVDGWIRNLGDNPAGSFVRKQQVLATYYAQNLIAAASTYVFALQTNAQALSGDATIGYQRGTTVLSLQVALDSLRALGMHQYQIDEIERTRLAPTEVRVYSPINGFVIARSISPEQRFDKGSELYRIADIGHVWVMAEVFERDSGFLKPGTRATVLYEGRRLEARMSNALPQFDPQTRTLKTRFELDNPGDVLRPDMFVDVELHVEMPAAVTVPSDAVVDSGLRKVVFVDRGNGYFEPRRVETGWRMGDRVQITKGLMAGERVVISGNFLLDSESRMKSAAMGLTNPETDPVCGMDVDRDRAKAAGRTASHSGTAYYFCSDDCRKKFEADPGKYAEMPRTMPAAAMAAQDHSAEPWAMPLATWRADEAARRRSMTKTPDQAMPMPEAANPAPMPGMAPTKTAPMAMPASTEVAQAKDLVCGMDVDPKDAAVAARKVEYKGKAYFFCSDDCKAKFAKEPGKYAKQ